MKTLYSILLVCVLIFFGACKEYKADNVMKVAGENRSELAAVLHHYSEVNPDKEKLKAAKFLIANMRWHRSVVVADSVRTANANLDALISEADTLLYQAITDSAYSVTNPYMQNREQLRFKKKYRDWFKHFAPKSCNVEQVV